MEVVALIPGGGGSREVVSKSCGIGHCAQVIKALSAQFDALFRLGTSRAIARPRKLRCGVPNGIRYGVDFGR